MGNAESKNQPGGIEGEWPEWKVGAALSNFGFDNPELDAWFKVVEAARLCLKLPAFHSMEKQELCHYFHMIQDQLLARPGLRVLGHKETKVQTRGQLEPESVAVQIKTLADFIMKEIPGEPSQSEGAVDCAMRIIRQFHPRFRYTVADETERKKQNDRGKKAKGETEPNSKP